MGRATTGKTGKGAAGEKVHKENWREGDCGCAPWPAGRKGSALPGARQVFSSVHGSDSFADVSAEHTGIILNTHFLKPRITSLLVWVRSHFSSLCGLKS